MTQDRLLTAIDATPLDDAGAWKRIVLRHSAQVEAGRNDDYRAMPVP